MIGLIQRVRQAKVEVDKNIISQIGQGLLLLLGVEKHDNRQSADKLCQKVLNYRVFCDQQGKMNLNLQQINGELMVVSQFTLVANTTKGNRPSFSSAAPPALAEELYEYFIQQAGAQIQVARGQFAADMQIQLINDGPVTFDLRV